MIWFWTGAGGWKDKRQNVLNLSGDPAITALSRALCALSKSGGMVSGRRDRQDCFRKTAFAHPTRPALIIHASPYVPRRVRPGEIVVNDFFGITVAVPIAGILFGKILKNIFYLINSIYYVTIFEISALQQHLQILLDLHLALLQAKKTCPN